jgi:hypothetical protein
VRSEHSGKENPAPAKWACSECGKPATWQFLGSPEDNVGMWLSDCCTAPSVAEVAE